MAFMPAFAYEDAADAIIYYCSVFRSFRKSQKIGIFGGKTKQTLGMTEKQANEIGAQFLKIRKSESF